MLIIATMDTAARATQRTYMRLKEPPAMVHFSMQEVWRAYAVA
jgi:hypothetical protein